MRNLGELVRAWRLVDPPDGLTEDRARFQNLDAVVQNNRLERFRRMPIDDDQAGAGTGRKLIAGSSFRQLHRMSGVAVREIGRVDQILPRCR